jgi:hypothetical protein
VFSDKVNAVSFHKEDYIHRIGPLMVQLVAHMSKAHMWDQAVYWLQQLLNHDVSSRHPLSVSHSKLLVASLCVHVGSSHR